MTMQMSKLYVRGSGWLIGLECVVISCGLMGEI